MVTGREAESSSLVHIFSGVSDPFVKTVQIVVRPNVYTAVS